MCVYVCASVPCASVFVCDSSRRTGSPVCLRERCECDGISPEQNRANKADIRNLGISAQVRTVATLLLLGAATVDSRCLRTSFVPFSAHPPARQPKFLCALCAAHTHTYTHITHINTHIPFICRLISFILQYYLHSFARIRKCRIDAPISHAWYHTRTYKHI